MNLQQIRDMVRAQLDLDDSDLPDDLLDSFVQDGFDRVVGLETRWPLYETTWQVTAPVEGSFPLPLDAREVTSVMSQSGRLVHIDARHAEDMFGWSPPTGAGGTPVYWSQLGQSIELWPQPIGTVLALRLRGWRKQAAWIAGGASQEVDADDRLHLPIVWYACSLGYAQQEDEVLEKTYMQRFEQGVTIAHAAVMRPWSGTPKIVNGYRALSSHRTQFTLGTP